MTTSTSHDSLNVQKSPAPSTSQEKLGDQNQVGQQPAEASSASSAATPFPTAGRPETQAAGGPAAGQARQAAGQAHEAIDEAQTKGDDFASRLVQGAHAAIDKVAGIATPAVERIKDSYGDATDKLSGVAGQASDMKDRWVADVRDIVRENPLAAIAAAIAVGAIYVKLTSTSRRNGPDREDD